MSGFTPRTGILDSNKPLSDIESLGLNEDMSSLPQQPEETVKDSMQDLTEKQLQVDCD